MTLAVCHPNRKQQARGMCKNCYDKWLKINNPIYKTNQLSNTTKWAKANPDKMRIITERRKAKDKARPDAHLRARNKMLKKYGMDQTKYLEMLVSQNNACAICFRKAGIRPLHVDHCHETGHIRGLLCHQCNWYLGIIDADKNVLKRIENYINWR